MKPLHSTSWTRWDGAIMKIDVFRTAKGIKSVMSQNGVAIMKTISKRPYLLGQACDGTIGECVHALYIDYCNKTGLDAEKLYIEAYPDDKEGYKRDKQNEIIRIALLEGVQYPNVWDQEAFNGLIESLTEINNHSLVKVLEDITPFLIYERKNEYEEIEKLSAKARSIMQKANLDPDEIWGTKFSIDDFVLQSGLSIDEVKRFVKRLQEDPDDIIHFLKKGMEAGIMYDWDAVAVTAVKEIF